MLNPITVYIMGHDPLARAGLSALLRPVEGCLLVGQASPDQSWETVLQVYHPAVVVWDLGWEVDVTLPLLQTISELNTPLLLLIPYGEPAAELLALGARAVLRRDLTGEQLWQAIQTLEQGLLVFDPSFLPFLSLPAAVEPPLPQPLAEPLTGREQEVLRHLAAGLTNKAIGQALGISQHTVKFHLTSMMQKLSAQSRTEVVMIASRLGLLPL
jgi:DNA-binding NarL/FixJ family response regulator